MYSLSYQSAVYHFSIVFELGNNLFHTLTNHRIHFASIAISYRISWMILNKKIGDDNLERSTEEWKKKKKSIKSYEFSCILCLTEYCSLWNSLSNSSEGLFQRGQGTGQYICDFSWWIHSIKSASPQKATASQISVISFRTFPSMGRYKNLE